MISNVWKTVLSILALMPMATVASADNINTSGVICRNYHASQALDIDYFSNKVANANASPREIICPIPRSPNVAPPPPGSPLFFVDGTNSGGTTTPCTVMVYDPLGNIMALESFSESLPTWSYPVTLPMQPPPALFDYASLFCILPASGSGGIFGVTTVQY